jgi:hypothetical protein
VIKRLIVPLFAVLVIGLVAAGCGSSDDSTTGSTDGGETSTASLTKAEFVKQGNAICKVGNEEIDGEFEKFAEENGLNENKEPTEAQFEEAAEEFLLPTITRQVEEIRALGTPEGEGEAIEAFLDNAEAEVEKVEGDPSLLGEDAFNAVNEEARAIGLTVCGEE